MRVFLCRATFLGALWGGCLSNGLAFGQEGPLGLFSLKPVISANPVEPAKKGAPLKEAQRISTRLATFGIPIVAPAARDDLKEIQLHVSADQGKTWHLYYRVSPADKYFPFKAAADGEYWFATRLVDANSRAFPEGTLQPEMKVVIDTTPPKLSITAKQSESGEIEAQWQASDPLLAPQSLKLEYQTAVNGPWRSIAVPARRSGAKESLLEGQVAWRPREASGIVNLRAEILDQAGNHAVALDRLQQGAIVRSNTPLEPPIAGPSQPRSEHTPHPEEKKESAFAGVSKWLGGALGGSANPSPPTDPYASSAPSDDSPSAITGASAPLGTAPNSAWSSGDTEFSKEGVRLPTLAERRAKTESPGNSVSDSATKPLAERRGPGRFASSTTLKAPPASSGDDQQTHESEEGAKRPSIQPPENATRDTANPLLRVTESTGKGEALEEVEAEEIPAPREEPRLKPVRRLSPEPTTEEEVPSVEAAPDRAVESLPSEESRQPIRSMPRARPEEFRTRSPISSGLSGAERGAARPPAKPLHHQASTSRDDGEKSTRESGRLPEGVEPIYSNRHRFGLEYDVNTVGPGGVSDVELWATRDGGASWSRWGADPDRRSPFEVEVDGEGVFGFRIVVMSRGGLASRPPQPGDEADQWVVVDSTTPKLALRSAAYGSEERVGQLEIAWDAQDANLTDKCVTLYYSDLAEGPWTKIVGDLANQGVYYWRVDSRVPPRIFIKVEVRDGAGNLSADQTREAIRVEGLVPSGKIRRIIPRSDDRE